MIRPVHAKRGRRRTITLMVVCAAYFGGLGIARAQEPKGGVEFRWDAPEGCPGEAEVLAELERLLGGPVAEQGQGRLAAIARVRQEADGRWDLRLWTVSEQATRQRSMEGEDCEVLAEAAALLAAMAIDPDVLQRAVASEAAVDHAERAEEVDAGKTPDAEPALEPEPELLEKDEPEPVAPVEEGAPVEERAPAETKPERAWIIGLRAQAGVSFGDLPSVGPILRVGAGMQWERARIELEGHYAFSRKARFADAPDRGADLRHGFGVLRGCGLLRYQRAKLEFPICVGIEVGAQSGRGVGYVSVSEGTIPWLALDLAPSLVWSPLTHLSLGLTVEPWVALLRRRFLTSDGTQIWRAYPLGIRVLAGLELRF